ncbi:MAG TPA: hypothetical protein VKG44_00950, partial [Candidatus Baltobacteraceae bacterium]|nr:hypothetical protein [Candidatus Baltobacteraceae bacterium]
MLASLVLAWACALPALADSSEPYPFPSYISLNVQPFAYVNNQLSNGFSVVPEPQVNVTITFRLADVPMILNQQVGEFAYYHPAGSVGNVPPPGSHFVGAENVLEYNIQQSIGIGVAPGWFLEGSQLYRTSNEFVDMIGLGVAGEKIPDFRRRTSLYGRLAFYPKWVNEDA